MKTCENKHLSHGKRLIRCWFAVGWVCWGGWVGWVGLAWAGLGGIGPLIGWLVTCGNSIVCGVEANTPGNEKAYQTTSTFLVGEVRVANEWTALFGCNPTCMTYSPSSLE